MTVAELIERLSRIPDPAMLVTIYADFDEGEGPFEAAPDPLDDPMIYLNFEYAKSVERATLAIEYVRDDDGA